MVIVDFVIIFVTCLAIALFSLENTQEVALKILPQYEIQIHLAVALVVAMGIGATLAGLYMVWIKVKNHLEFTRQKRQVKEQEQRIQQLKQDMESRQAELEQLRQEKLSSQIVAEHEDFADEQQASDSNNLAVSVEAN